MTKLTLIDKAFFLKKTALFAKLELDLLLPIADKLGVSAFDPGEIIFSAGEDAHLMYVIVTGKVEIEGAFLGSEDFFGDESLFSERPRSYTAISKEDTLTLTLSRTNLLAIISECPSVALALLAVYATVGNRKQG